MAYETPREPVHIQIMPGVRWTLTPDRFWLTRHYIALSSLASVFIALAAPGSLNARAMAFNGALGWALMGTVGVLALLLILEAFTTAFCSPHTVLLPFLRNRRHTFLMLLAMTHLSTGVLIINLAPDSAALMVRFGVDAAASMAVAFLDLFQRHRADQCSK